MQIFGKTLLAQTYVLFISFNQVLELGDFLSKNKDGLCLHLDQRTHLPVLHILSVLLYFHICPVWLRKLLEPNFVQYVIKHDPFWTKMCSRGKRCDYVVPKSLVSLDEKMITALKG